MTYSSKPPCPPAGSIGEAFLRLRDVWPGMEITPLEHFDNELRVEMKLYHRGTLHKFTVLVWVQEALDDPAYLQDRVQLAGREFLRLILERA